MESLLILIVFVVCVFVFIYIMKPKEKPPELPDPDKPFDDSHMPDFAPYLKERIRGEDDDGEDDDVRSYDDLIQY